MAVRAVIGTDHEVFVIPHHAAIAKIIPPVAEFQSPDGHMMVLPHNYAATKLARNMGFKVLAPIMARYNWRGTIPFRSQKLTAAMMTMNRRGYVLNEMGTGKTRAALFAIDYMIQTKQAHRCLIVAPLSTLTDTWDLEVLMYFPHLRVATLHGTREKRLKMLEREADIYLINHDGIQTILPELQAARGIDMVLIDELGKFRNSQTDRWEALEAILERRTYVWGMTGSPMPKAPSDAWAQCRLVTPNAVPGRFGTFRKKVMYKITQFKWAAKHDAKEIVYGIMQPAIRFARKEVVELPPLTHSVRQVPLSPAQDRAYKTLMAHGRIAYQQGEVNAANEGVLFNKLMQVACGWVYTSNKDTIDLSPTARIEALTDVIDEAAGKVIVFVAFKHAAHYVMEALESKAEYAGQVAFVSGDVGKTARDKVFRDFRNPAGKRILVAHPECMSHGLNLQIANVIVWFSLPPGLDTFDQACARITRPGQKNNMFIVYLIGTPIERKVHKRLQDQASMQGALLELFESEREAA